MAAVWDVTVVSIQNLFFDLDLGTGAVSNLVMGAPFDFAIALTQASDGTLFTLKSLEDWRPATVDR